MSREKKQVDDLFDAIENGDEDKALQMLRQDFNNASSALSAAAQPYEYLASARDEDGNTALHYAVWKGRTRVIQELLSMKKKKKDSSGAEDVLVVDVNVRDEDGSTPLHLAVSWGHKEVAQMLIDASADATIKDNDVCECQHVCDRLLLETKHANNIN